MKHCNLISQKHHNKKIYFIIAILSFIVPFISLAELRFDYIDDVQLPYKEVENLDTIPLVFNSVLPNKNDVSYRIKINSSVSKYKIDDNTKTIEFQTIPTKLLEDNKILSNILLNIISTEYSIKNPSRIEWLAEGISRKILRVIYRPNRLENSDFPYLHILTSREIEINPKDIINSSLSNGIGSFLQLYSESCEILLNTILQLNNSSPILNNYLTMISQNSNIDSYKALLDTTLPNEKKADYIFKKSFNLKAKEYSLNYFMPLSAQQTIDRFNKIKEVNYTSKKTNKQVKCLIFELPARKSDIKNINKVIQNLAFKINDIKLISNRLLWESISKVIDAVKSIPTSNYNEGVAAIKKSMWNFEMSAAELKTLETRMYQLELKNNGYAKRFNNFFKISSETKKLNRETYPALEKYLDDNV